MEIKPFKTWHAEEQFSIESVLTFLNILWKAGIPPEYIKITGYTIYYYHEYNYRSDKFEY